MCDTFVAVSVATRDKSVIFGKNSDREPNEAQCLEYYPSKKFLRNQSLDCTYIRIPQVSETYGVLVCRPFWMWGAEMGANEHGVVIRGVLYTNQCRGVTNLETYFVIERIIGFGDPCQNSCCR